MKTLECIIFNVDHGFCSFIKSPNNYGLLIDCGCRQSFSPIKWIRRNYNFNNGNISYFSRRRFAEAIITHLHLDHFEDVGSFSLNSEDQPKRLTREKEIISFIDEKIENESDNKRKNIFTAYKKFQSRYTEKSKEKIDWGFDFYESEQLKLSDAKSISKAPDNLINNRSFITGISFSGRKILFTGDMEIEGWEKAFENKDILKILEDTNFYIASHHGHKSGFTTKILEFCGIPDLYIVSAKRGDEHIDSSYSKAENVNGFLIKGDKNKTKMVSTRECQKSIKIIINEKGESSVELIDTPDNIDSHQKKLITRETDRFISKIGLKK